MTATKQRLAPMAVAMAAFLIVYGAWRLCGWPHTDRSQIGDAFFAPIGIASLISLFAASRRCRAQPRLRWAWRLIALGGLVYLLGDAAESVYESVGRLPFPSLADAFYLPFYPLVLGGLLLAAPREGGAGHRTRIGLDLAVVALSASAVMVYVILGPELVASSSNAFKTAVAIAYPVGDVLLIVAIGSVMLRGLPPSGELAFGLLAVGLVFFVAGDVIYNYIQLHSVYRGGDAVDWLYMSAVAMFGVAAAAQAPPRPCDAPLDRPPRASWLPSGAVVIGFVLLLYTYRDAPWFPGKSLLVASALIALLVSLRQYLAQRDLIGTQRQLSHQAVHDHLTGLLNRGAVVERARQLLAEPARDGAPVVAIRVDIDGFKNVNDSFGHSAGDQLLKVVAERLSRVARAADTAGRIGGDEFVVLLGERPDDRAPEQLAERICQSAREPVVLGQHEVAISVSAGIAAGAGISPEQLLHDADHALCSAKQAGKNCWRVFRDRAGSDDRGHVRLAFELRDAIAAEQFFLVYQPIIDLRNMKLTGVETLIRWRHPTRGILAPAAFIPAAESNGTILPIGQWVLRTACLQAAAWREAGTPIGISVNVSPEQMHDDRLVQNVSESIELAGLEPRLLCLEITESTVMRDTLRAESILHELKSLGVHVAIDDFGIGYSSLAYLHRFPFDVLKIDRSFIGGMMASRDLRVMVHTLVQLGNDLGLRTLAEGIENADQLAHLQQESCRYGQGFLLGRPVPPDELDVPSWARAGGASQVARVPVEGA
jgi:diguanylate cyclase (GGDEF)-like protein